MKKSKLRKCHNMLLSGYFFPKKYKLHLNFAPTFPSKIIKKLRILYGVIDFPQFKFPW